MQQPYTIILAPNPSILTGPGTNTILLGGGAQGALVIDPAVDDSVCLDAVVQAGAERGGIGRILITHGHPDHMGGAVALRDRLGVYIYAFSRQGVPVADEEITGGTIFPAGGETLEALHTHSHRLGHLCFLLHNRPTLFAGDILSCVTPNLTAPPDGVMLEYLNSLTRLREIEIC